MTMFKWINAMNMQQQHVCIFAGFGWTSTSILYWRYFADWRLTKQRMRKSTEQVEGGTTRLLQRMQRRNTRVCLKDETTDANLDTKQQRHKQNQATTVWRCKCYGEKQDSTRVFHPSALLMPASTSSIYLFLMALFFYCSSNISRIIYLFNYLIHLFKYRFYSNINSC